MKLQNSARGVPGAALVAGLVFGVAMLGAGCTPTDVHPGSGAGCNVEEPCAAPNVCQDGTCVAPCTAGAGCVEGLCDLDSGRCVDCLTTDDCSPGKVCNEFSNRCVDPIAGCSTDDDCSGLICDTIKGGCVECLSDGDCSDGALCDQLTSTCTSAQGCVTDGDCTDGVCDPAKRICVECFNPAHCASGVCDTVTSTCVAAGCTDDDASEPNDGADALAIASGGAHEGAICPGDVDEFTIDAAGTLTATLTLNGGGALSLVLASAGGTVLATAAPTNDDTLTLVAAGLGQASYRLVVAGADAGAGGDYLLSVDVEQETTCTQLDAEPNGTTGTAPVIAADDALHTGAICGSDVDLFKFTAAAGDDVEAAVIPGDGAGVLALSLLDANGNQLASAAAGSTATLSDVAGGTFFVRVAASGGDVTYSVRVNATNAPPVCNQTDAEPNDADAQALSLQAGVTSSGTVCPGDVDQFRFAAVALDDAAITVSGAGLTAKLIRASDGAQIATGLTMTAHDLAGGGYRIVVQGSSSSTQATYTVRVDLTPEPVPDPCLENGIEPDSLAAGRSLALDGTPLAGRICASDTDFFTFTLPFTSTVTAHARFTHANGDLDIRLVDATGAEIGFSDGVTNDEIIVKSLAAGTYTVEIFGFSGALNTYTMDATLQGCTPEDGFEDNNAVARATPIATQAVSAARCPGDDDFFAIRLENGDSLDATLAGAGLTFSLVSAADGSVARNDTASGGNRRIQASGLPAGRYAFRVTGSSPDRIAYTLTPSITPSSARCVDDGANPNERAVDAFALDATGLADGSYEVGALMSCDEFDQDWFKIQLPANKLVTVQLAFASADDVDVELLEPKGASGLTRSLARSFATNKQDRVSGMINQAGSYFIMAEGFRTTPEPYGVGITVADPPPSSCVNDRFDSWSATSSSTTDTQFRNDDVTTSATELSSSESFANMRICPGDHDFFVEKSVAAGKHVVVHVDYVHTSARDIDVRLYGPADQVTPLASSLGTDGNEDIDFTVVTAGNYFIEVHEFLDDGENFYDMTAAVQ